MSTRSEMKGATTESANTATNSENYGEDKDGLTKESAVVMEYLDKLKPQCECDLPPSYEERKQPREKEIGP